MLPLQPFTFNECHDMIRIQWFFAQKSSSWEILSFKTQHASNLRISLWESGSLAGFFSIHLICTQRFALCRHCATTRKWFFRINCHLVLTSAINRMDAIAKSSDTKKLSTKRQKRKKNKKKTIERRSSEYFIYFAPLAFLRLVRGARIIINATQ